MGMKISVKQKKPNCPHKEKEEQHLHKIKIMKLKLWD